MKKMMVAVAALSLGMALPSLAAAGVGDESAEEIKKELEYLRLKMSSQMERVEHLEDQLKKQGEKSGKVVLANEFIDQLTLKGDLRVRYERRELDYKETNASEKDQDRWRTRFRVGGIWNNKAEDWQVGAGLATGSDDPTSTNDTWSEDKPFETGDIRLDYAYAAHKWQDFMFTLGQQNNPYETSWVMWDGDVRLAGITGQYGKKEGLFATLGGYAAKLVASDNTATLTAGQLGYRGKAADAKYTLAAGYHTFSKSLINEGSATFNLGTVDENMYELNIGDLYGKVSFPVAQAKLALVGHVWKNFGADGAAGTSQASTYTGKPEDADTGYALGIEATIDKFKVGYDYSVVEADSLFGYLADSDFGDGLSDTNKKGHRVQLGYNMTKNWSAGVTWLNYERDEDTGTTGVDSVDLYQFDVNYKF
ncbi:MAG: putative porin [Thermodesulfobacteriota bacterium]